MADPFTTEPPSDLGDDALPADEFASANRSSSERAPFGDEQLEPGGRGAHHPTHPRHESSLAAPGRSEDRSSVVAARGTSEGLVLRIDGRTAEQDLSTAVREFVESRRSFLSGHDVAFEWVGRKPDEAAIQALTTLLSSEFAISVRSSRLKSAAPRPLEQPAPATPPPAYTPQPARITHPAAISPSAAPLQPSLSVVGGSGRPTPLRQSSQHPGPGERVVSLFDGIEGYDSRSASVGGIPWDEADARIFHGTLRSGQKVESEHSIIICGDVNSGAEVTSGGDIIILGTLRGIAHAGAFDETGGGRVIMAMNLQPTQLRIGLVISRGGAGERSEKSARPGSVPEIARVDGNSIVVEPYQSRSIWSRKGSTF